MKYFIFSIIFNFKGSEPDISNLYSTKSGSKRIFQSAKVEMPHGEFDIYNKEQVSSFFSII